MAAPNRSLNTFGKCCGWRAASLDSSIFVPGTQSCELVAQYRSSLFRAQLSSYRTEATRRADDVPTAPDSHQSLGEVHKNQTTSDCRPNRAAIASSGDG